MKFTLEEETRGTLGKVGLSYCRDCSAQRRRNGIQRERSDEENDGGTILIDAVTIDEVNNRTNEVATSDARNGLTKGDHGPPEFQDQ